MPWPRALLLILALLPAAQLAAAEVPCPLADEGRLALPERPWNLGGGVDSDGCAYGVDAKGRRRVLGLEVVAECARCGGVFLTQSLGGSLPQGRAGGVKRAEVQSLLAAYRKERAAPGRLDEGARLEVSAEIYLAFGQRWGLSEGARRALAGRLYLRAAWAARGAAVHKGPEAGYRPRDLGQVKEHLRSLADRHDADPAAESSVRQLDTSLADIERARRALAKQPAATPPERFAQLEARLSLDRLEEAFYARKAQRLAELREEQPLGRAELGLARICALIRAGEFRGARSALGAAGEGPLVAAIRSARGEEQRLLGLACAELRAAGPLEPDPRKAALLFFLAGDAARRRGQDSLARALLEKARELAPQDQAGQRAALLLGS